MRFGMFALLGVALTTFSAGTASAYTTFDFTSPETGPNGHYDSPTPFVSVGGISISASGGTYASDTIISFDSRRVTKSGNGLGVDCPLGGGALLCPDEIDGPLDLLTLHFDQKVVFHSALFSEVDSDDDFDLFIDGNLVLSDVNIAAANPFDLMMLTGTSISFGADAGTLNQLNEDDFRLAAISVSKIPLPATLPLLLGVLGAGVLLGRARR